MNSGSPSQCAGDLLDTIPMALRSIHAHMRKAHLPGISMVHFRVLAFLNFNHDATLSAVAERLGVSLPSMSRTVNVLVGKGLVQRQILAGDRRKMSLRLTKAGKSLLATARRATQARLARDLSNVPAGQLLIIQQALAALRNALDSTASHHNGRAAK